jgi:O-methyltransferase involved in polyketide biosynthesis
MKGLTDIPFMADAVKLVWGQGASTVLGKRAMDETFFKRLLHFEARYKSVSNLLETLGGQNILEMSSGFSFRGLDMVLQHPGITYIDTDLPGVIATKNNIIDQLIVQQSLDLQGELLIMPMNVLDEDRFGETIRQFSPGPTTIVNEGLLMYLNTKEKKQLLKIIHHILSQNGGYWITADIYIKKPGLLLANDPVSEFLQAHHVEENKFESFEQAEAFFADNGFKIHQKAGKAGYQLSAIKYIPLNVMEEIAQQAAKIGRIRETWVLSAV